MLDDACGVFIARLFGRVLLLTCYREGWIQMGE